VSEDFEVADVSEVTVACDDEAVGPPSDPDEHPAMNAPRRPNVANVPVAAV